MSFSTSGEAYLRQPVADRRQLDLGCERLKVCLGTEYPDYEEAYAVFAELKPTFGIRASTADTVAQFFHERGADLLDILDKIEISGDPHALGEYRDFLWDACAPEYYTRTNQLPDTPYDGFMNWTQPEKTEDVPEKANELRGLLNALLADVARLSINKANELA